MVVLSACVTGRGEATEGEGVVNFARAFHQAGARSVVVSLWEVASEAAEDFMRRFYGHLQAGKPKAEALALARKEIKALYPNPFFWAAFILHGEGVSPASAGFFSRVIILWEFMSCSLLSRGPWSYI